MKKGIALAVIFLLISVITPFASTAGPERAGEEITYHVKLGNIYLGQAKFKYPGRVRVGSRELNLLIFETKVANFSDREKIYSDPRTYLPVKIERQVNNLLKRERISEEYDQKNYRVTISKINGKKLQQVVISKDGPIHNAVLFPFVVRDIPGLSVGRVFRVNLPLRKLQVKLVSIEELKLSSGTYQAFHFESTPRQIAVWISTDERRIPLKIEGAGVFGYTLILKDYQPNPVK
jgi:hypothetical protein